LNNHAAMTLTARQLTLQRNRALSRFNAFLI